jgi:hypothetical protein
MGALLVASRSLLVASRSLLVALRSLLGASPLTQKSGHNPGTEGQHEGHMEPDEIIITAMAVIAAVVAIGATAVIVIRLM